MTFLAIRSVAPWRGVAWVIEGFSLFRRSPLNWLAVILLLWAAFQIGFGLAAITSGVSALVLVLLTPAFSGGIMLGCAQFDQGRAINMAHLLAGFRHHGPRLIALGGVYLLGQVAVFWLMQLAGGDSLMTILEGRGGELSESQISEAMPLVMRAFVIGLSVTVPMLMAMAFAAPLVALGNLAPWAALAASLRACVRNLPAMFLYGMALFGLFLVAALPFSAMDPYSNPAPWIVAPAAIPSLYIAYRDLFAVVEAPPESTPE